MISSVRLRRPGYSPSSPAPGATNVAQIVISGTKRHRLESLLSIPAFSDAYSDDEIAAVANYVTACFGAQGSRITAEQVATLRKQAAE
jgi:mono/diheme cytochrome c family protein